jgi:hypothetical protein
VFTIKWKAVHVAVESVFTIPWKHCSPSRGIRMSSRLAEALRAVSVAEMAQADQANARMGLDGEDYYFDAEGRCAFAWSPDTGSRPDR